MIKAQVQKESKSEASMDTVDAILEAHFESFTKPCLEALIGAWSGQGEDIDDKRDAILFLYRATNDPKEKFVKFLCEEFGGDVSLLSGELLNSYKTLDVISNHATGSVKDTDPIWGQCRRLSSINESVLEKHIGAFFRDKTNECLRSIDPDLFESVRQECESLDMAANDRDASPIITSPVAVRVVSLATIQSHK